jgi:hypothetical protein
MKIEVSNGEVVDKFTILLIKLENSDKLNIHNIKKEYDYLEQCVLSVDAPRDLIDELLSINRSLWKIEDQLRIMESEKNFSEKFIELARMVYITNDRRAMIKKDINLKTNSQFVEEKILPEY